jgi:stage III sporulation protein AE
MKLLKNSIGIYAVIATAITFIPTLINLLMWKFSLFISQSFAQILEVKNVGTLCKSISQVFSILIAVVLVFSMLIIISTTLIIIVTTGGG